MRVVHIVKQLTHYGGVTRFCEEVLPRINACSTQHHSVLSLGPPGASKQRLQDRGLEVREIGGTSRWQRKRHLLAARRWIRSSKCALVHLHQPECVWAAQLLTAGADTTQTVHFHGFWDDYWRLQPRWKAIIHRRALARAKHFAAVSSAVAEWLQSDPLLAPTPRRIVPNGCRKPLEPQDALARRKRIRAELGLTERHPLIGLVARPSRYKKHKVFVAAAQRLHQRFPEARFALIGSGDLKYERKLDAWIKEAGLDACCIRAGNQARPEDWMAAMDVGVLCSNREGFGLVVLEYMACNVPVVVSDIPALRELVQPRVNGLHAQVGNPESLAAAIQAYLNDKALAQSCREAGRRFVHRFTWDATARNCASFFAETLDPAHP